MISVDRYIMLACQKSCKETWYQTDVPITSPRDVVLWPSSCTYNMQESVKIRKEKVGGLVPVCNRILC